MSKTHNSDITGQLKRFVERIEKLNEDIQDLQDDHV